MEVSPFCPTRLDHHHDHHHSDRKQSGAESHRLGDIVVNRDCSNLLALAIMLLEISSGQPVEKRRKDSDGAQNLPDDQADLQVAEEWHKEEKSRGSLSCAFSQAILTCLQEYLNPDTDFDDPKFCDAFKERVLLPLEEEMQFLLFGPPR